MRSNITAAIIVAVATLGSISLAQATPVLHAKVNGVNVVLGSTGIDNSIIPTGAFSGNQLTFIGAPNLQELLRPTIIITGSLQASGPGTLKIELSETDILTSSANWVFESTFHALTAGGITYTYESYVDPNNHAFVNGKHLASGSGTTTPVGFDSLTIFGVDNPLTITPPFSMTEVFTITTSKGGTHFASDFGAELVGVDPVPEPASLALLGTAIAGLGLARRRAR